MLFFVLAIVISVVYGGISIHKDHRTGVTSLTQRMVQFKDEPSILGIAVDENALYYSTGQQIVQILANGDANPLVNTVVDIAFIGYNLGRAMDEIIQILVHEKPCTNTNYVNASYVTCTVGLNTTSVSKNEIVFQTTRGKMKGMLMHRYDNKRGWTRSNVGIRNFARREKRTADTGGYPVECIALSASSHCRDESSRVFLRHSIRANLLL